MRYNKKILMVTTTALFAVGCLSLMGAMKYQNVKTEASDIKEDDVARAGVDVTSERMEGETPSEEEKKMDKEVVETYSYKRYEISFIRYKDIKTGEYLSDKEQAGDYGYKKTFRDIIDKSENSGWGYMLEKIKGKKDKITAEVDWHRDNSKIINGKFYGKLMRECCIRFKSPYIKEDTQLRQRQNIGGFTTVAESGKYIAGGRADSWNLMEYSQWALVSKSKRNEIKEKLDELKKLAENKKETAEYIEKVKSKVIKELKDVYGINFVKEEDVFKDIADGNIMFYGQTDDGQKIEALYDLVGDYISYFSYR